MAPQPGSTEGPSEIPGQQNEVRERQAADTQVEETVEFQQAFPSRPASRPVSLRPGHSSPPALIAPRSAYNLSPIPDEQELQVSSQSRQYSVVETRQTTAKEREAFNKLEQAGRRWFIATLSNRFVEEPLQEAMPNISQ